MTIARTLDDLQPVCRNGSRAGQSLLGHSVCMLEIVGCFRDGQPVDAAFVGVVDADQGKLKPALHSAMKAVKGRHDFVWLALTDPTPAELDIVAHQLNIDHDSLTDAADPRHRAGIDIRQGQAMTIVKELDFCGDESPENPYVEGRHLAVLTGPHFAVSVTVGWTRDWGPLCQAVTGSGNVEKIGSATVSHAVMETTLKQYLRLLDEIGADIDELEKAIFTPGRADHSPSVYRLKRGNLELRGSLKPLLPAAQIVHADAATKLKRHQASYFRDIADRVLRAYDTVETYDRVLHSMLSAASTRIDLQQNADMRKISAWVAMAAVPTMLAGIYGMNFDHMPELHWIYGYPAVLVTMAGVVSFMAWRFKRAGWL